MREVEIQRIGNGLGVALPDEAVERLQVKEGQTAFLVESPDGGYRLTAKAPDLNAKLDKAADIMVRYRNTLKILAQ